MKIICTKQELIRLTTALNPQMCNDGCLFNGICTETGYQGCTNFLESTVEVIPDKPVDGRCQDVTAAITDALCQLGYESPLPKIIPISHNQCRVELNGEYFGIWDDNKNTFVD